MSEFLAEAQVLIRPNTAGFRATLLTELRKATAGIVVPIPIVAAGAAAATAGKQATQANAVAAASGAKAAAQAKQLAEAERLTAVATAEANKVTLAGVGATSALSKAKLELTASSRAVVAAERAVDVALGTSNAQVTAAAVDQLRLAVAQEAVARTAVQEAAALSISGKAALKSAGEHEALARGVAAEGLTFLGLRGATLAASAPFLIGTAAVVGFVKALHAARDEQEAAARVTAVLGTALEERLAKSASKLATSFGLSTSVALKFEGQLANILDVSGFATEKTADLSERLTKLAADMAAFSNVPLETTLKAISLGLVGNSRGLRQFGVELNAAAVNQEALLETGKDDITQLTRRERVQARINLLFEQTANQQGAAANRAGDLAQKTRILESQMENLGVAVGNIVIPAVTGFVGIVSKAIGPTEKLVDLLGKLGPQFLASGDAADEGGKKSESGLRRLQKFVGGSLFDQVRTFNDQLRVAGTYLGIVGEKGSQAAGGVDITIASLRRGIPVLGHFTNELVTLQSAFGGAAALFRKGLQLKVTAAFNQLDTLNDAVTKVRVSGGGLAAQLAAAAAATAKAQQAFDRASAQAAAITGGPGAGTARENRKRALDALDQAQQQEQSIRDEITSNAEQAASEAKQRADELKKEDADNAFLDALDVRRGKFDLGFEIAHATAKLTDDIAIQKRYTLELTREIVEIRNSALAEDKKAAAIHDLTVKRQKSIVATREFVDQQKQADRERQKLIADRQLERADLDIQIANAKGQVSAEHRETEAKEREARIRLDKIRIANVRGDIVLKKQLQLDIAQQRKAIDDLRKEQAKKNEASRQLQFEFLQAQQGFAANILSNLLPTSAVAGTVGGGAISTATNIGPGPADFATAAHQRGRPIGDLTSTSATTGGPAGVTSGQFSALLHIARAQLVVLQRLAGVSASPEANHQSSWQYQRQWGQQWGN